MKGGFKGFEGGLEGALEGDLKGGLKRGFKGLKSLKGLKGGFKGLKGGFKGLKGLKGLKGGFKGLKGGFKGLKGLKGFEAKLKGASKASKGRLKGLKGGFKGLTLPFELVRVQGTPGFWTDRTPKRQKSLSRKSDGSTLDGNVRGRAPRKHDVGKPASSLCGDFAEGPRKPGGSFLISIRFSHLFF